MTPEAGNALVRAGESLREARMIAAPPLARAAARSAYYAMFHAAEALIFERTGRAAKTHSGVRSEFLRLVREEADGSRELGRILKDGYRFKKMADYWAEPDDVISDRDAAAMIDAASCFIDRVAALLSTPRSDAES